MRRTLRTALRISVALVLLAGLSSCSRSPGDLIAVDISSGAMSVAPDTARSGPVRFEIDHQGGATFNLLLMPGKSPADLPLNDDGSIDLSRRPIDKIELLAPGKYRAESPNVPVGEYVWVAARVTEDADGQEVNHYEEGLWAALVITPRRDITEELG